MGCETLQNEITPLILPWIVLLTLSCFVVTFYGHKLFKWLPFNHPMGCFNVKEYHLRCYKCNFVAYSNQKSSKLLISHQDIMKMKY